MPAPLLGESSQRRAQGELAGREGGPGGPCEDQGWLPGDGGWERRKGLEAIVAGA